MATINHTDRNGNKITITKVPTRIALEMTKSTFDEIQSAWLNQAPFDEVWDSLRNRRIVYSVWSRFSK